MIPPDAGGQNAHREGGDRGDPVAQRLGSAIGRVSRHAGRVEPQERLPGESASARDPHEKRRGDADEERAVGVEPEHRRADQEIANACRRRPR